MAWNYKQTGTPTLSEEFRQLYIVSLKGKECVTYNGLIALGTEKGIKSLTTEIIDLPRADNNFTVIIKATLVGYEWNPLKSCVDEVTYTDYGDANTKNCNPMVAPHYIRMASTRAKGRVLRDYTKIGMVALEEMGGSIVEEEKISKQQMTVITALCKAKGITTEDKKKAMKSKLVEISGQGDLKKASAEQAQALIEYLDALPSTAEDDEEEAGF